MPLREKMLLRLLLSGFLAVLFISGAGAQNLTPPRLPAPEAQPDLPRIAPVQPAAAQHPLDLIATITLATGKSETFARQIDRVEIITRPGGAIALIHLILVAGGQRNTHVWYNYDQVTNLIYRFVNPDGSAKVYVLSLQSSPFTREITDRLEPLSPREFRR